MRKAEIIITSLGALLFLVMISPNADGLTPGGYATINGTSSIDTPKFFISDKPISILIEGFDPTMGDGFADIKISITDPTGKSSEFDVIIGMGVMGFHYPIEVDSPKGIYHFSVPDTSLFGSFEILSKNTQDENKNSIIPEWVKNIFIWYGQNQVSETELLNAIKFLINEEIIILDSTDQKNGRDFSLYEQEECEKHGGLWGYWGIYPSYTNSCNPPTSDAGKQCTDSTQCESYCQASKNAEIDSHATGTCYGHQHAQCMQEIVKGKVYPEWCT